ncbi:MAG: isochorismatase family cysteine hydrolase [Nanoarchaeota archaeon]
MKIINPAVLVIDIQNDCCAHQGAFRKAGRNIKDVQDIVPKIKLFLEHCRSIDVPIIFIQAIYDNKFLSKNIQEMYAKQGFKDLCQEKSWGSEFYGIKPDKEDTIFIKHRYDAFTNEKLSVWLRANRIKTLIFTGCQTDVCVDSTARSGFMKGYYIVAIEDCLASTNLSRHKKTLEFMVKYYNAELRLSTNLLRKCNDR